MSLAAGRLCHRITIEQPVTTLDSNTGAPITAWSTWANVWAEVAPLSAREFIAAQAVQSQVTTRITVRYRDGLLSTMRIRYRGLVYNIAGVLPDNLSGLEYITLPCIAAPYTPSVLQTFPLLMSSGGYLLVSDGGKLLGATA